jgi:TonB family protein
LRQYREAYLTSRQARTVLAPLAKETQVAQMSEGERLYATAWAWELGLASFLKSSARPVPDLGHAPSRPQTHIDGLRLCALKADWPQNLARFYPREARDRGQVSGGVVRVRINADGTVREVAIAAMVGARNSGFEERALEVTRQVVFSRSDDEKDPTCRISTNSYLLPISFRFGSR